jgi:DNA-binding transcriptional MerR regulator
MHDEPLWTLRELTAEVASQLARNYEAADNGQVRAIPDERSIRYYTTLGLLDRPATMRGRTALYGRRHLAQLVAIKRMQALGKSLAEIQGVLPTLDDATLARIAGVELPAVAPVRAARSSFWRDIPSLREAPGSPSQGVADPIATAPAAPEEAIRARGFVPTWTLPLAPGVMLTLTPARPPNDADADAITRAAEALRAELARRGLIDPGE